MLQLIAAGIGAAASLAGSKSQAKAQRQAADVQARSAEQQLQFQREAYQNADRIFQPYTREGGQARRTYNALMGMPSGDYQAYLRENPDIMSWWNTLTPEVKAQYNNNPVDFAQWHHETQSSDRALPMAGSSQAMQQFQASPFSAVARDAADRGVNAMFSTQAAMGRGLNSGKALRAAADWNDQTQRTALVQYMGALDGVANRGFEADNNRVASGQAFANNASAASQRGADAMAGGYIGAANARSQGLQDVAGFVGWGLGQMGGGQSGQRNALFYSQPQAQTMQAATVRPATMQAIRPGGQTNFRF